MKEIDPQELNDTVWATIAPSSIHGVGVFAIRDIPKGQKINAQGGTGEWIRTDLAKVEPEVRKLILQRWPLEVDGYPYLSPNDDAILISFMNHSKEPNYDKQTDEALRDIKKGEEITEDYGPYEKIINIK
jgi:SET domain-containing protein